MIMSNRHEHPEIVERLSDYVDGALTPDEHAETEAHLAECGACRRVLESLTPWSAEIGRAHV